MEDKRNFKQTFLKKTPGGEKKKQGLEFIPFIYFLKLKLSVHFTVQVNWN
jgi:hypothetical protein